VDRAGEPTVAQNQIGLALCNLRVHLAPPGCTGLFLRKKCFLANEYRSVIGTVPPPPGLYGKAAGVLVALARPPSCQRRAISFAAPVSQLPDRRRASARYPWTRGISLHALSITSTPPDRRGLSLSAAVPTAVRRQDSLGSLSFCPAQFRQNDSPNSVSDFHRDHCWGPAPSLQVIFDAARGFSWNAGSLTALSC
jgi:hypothetical protein